MAGDRVPRGAAPPAARRRGQPADGAGAAGAAGSDEATGRWLETLFASAPIAVAFLDRQLRYLQVNDRLAQLNGVSAAEHAGRTIFDVVPDLADAAAPLFRQVLDSGEALRDIEIAGQTAADPGVERIWREDVYPVRDEQDAVCGVAVVAEDVTALRRAESQALLATRWDSERLYTRGLIEASIDGLVTVDPGLRVTDVNEQMCRMTGRSRDELLGSRFDRYFTDPAAAAEGVYRTLQAGSVADYELELVSAAGAPVVVSFNAARFTDPAGAVQGIFAAARDVTDRRRAEAEIALAREHERFRAEQAAIFADFAGRIASDAEPGGVLQRMTKHVADFIGDTCGVFVVDDDGTTLRHIAWHSRLPEAVEMALRLMTARPGTTAAGPAGEVLRTGRALVFREVDAAALRAQVLAEYHPFLDRFGSSSAAYVPLRAGGKTVGVVATYRFAGHPAYTDDEISFLEEFAVRASLAYENAREAAERRKSQELLDAIFQTLPDLICIAGLDGYFRVLNPAWERVLGWTVEELCARPYIEFVHPADRQPTLAAHDTLTRQRQAVASFENRYRCPDGSYRWLQWNSLPLPERGILLASARDITERRQAEEELASSHQELERRSAELERSNRDLEQFAYVASHDLQEPLRMVASYTTLLEEDLGADLDEDARRHLNFARVGAIRMQQLVSDLLRYSRVSRGPDVGRERVDCDQLVEAVTADLHEAIVAAGASVTHDRLPSVRGLRIELRQLFTNLVSNAVKFRGEQPVRVHVGVVRAGDMWQFSVADNGIGIDPAQGERIFEVFKRLHPRANYPGTGIGLAICKKVVEHHGGRIWVESAPGAGATFRFTLRADEDGGPGR